MQFWLGKWPNSKVILNILLSYECRNVLASLIQKPLSAPSNHCGPPPSCHTPWLNVTKCILNTIFRLWVWCEGVGPTPSFLHMLELVSPSVITLHWNNSVKSGFSGWAMISESTNFHYIKVACEDIIASPWENRFDWVVPTQCNTRGH